MTQNTVSGQHEEHPSKCSSHFDPYISGVVRFYLQRRLPPMRSGVEAADFTLSLSKGISWICFTVDLKNNAWHFYVTPVVKSAIKKWPGRHRITILNKMWKEKRLAHISQTSLFKQNLFWVNFLSVALQACRINRRQTIYNLLHLRAFHKVFVLLNPRGKLILSYCVRRLEKLFPSDDWLN